MAKTLVGALRVTLGLDSTEFGAGVARVQASTKRLATNLALIGGTVSVVGAGIAAAVRKQINAADDMVKTASKIGVPIEELSKLAYVADLSGVSMATLQVGLSQLSKNLIKQPDLFKKLGLSVRDATGEMRPTSEIVADIAGLFATMPDGAEKTALAMQLFGKSGAEMIPLLNSGKEGIKSLSEEAQAMGLVFTEETGRAAEQFNDNLTRLQSVSVGVARIIAAQLAPVLLTISEYVISAAAAFQSLSPEVQSLIAWVAGLTVVLGPVIIALGLVVGALGALLSPVVLTAGAIALLAAGIYAMLPTMEEWRKFWSDIGTIIEYAGMKIGEFISGAIESLKTAFSDLWTSATEIWEGIKTSIGGAIDFVTAKWDAFVGKLTAAIQTARDVGTAISEALMLGEGTVAGGALGDGLVAGILNGRSGAVAAGASLGASAAEGLRSYLGIQSPSRVAAGYGLNVAEGLAQGMEEGQGLVATAAAGMGDVAAGAMKTVGDLGSRIGDMFATAATNVLTGVQSLREAVSQLLGQIAQLLINSAMKSLFGDIFGGLDLGGDVGGYATGTFSAARGLAMVGEQGPELINLRGGERIMNAPGTRRMLAPGAAAQAQPAQVTSNVYLDGELIRSQIETFEGEAAIGRVMRRMGVTG